MQAAATPTPAAAAAAAAARASASASASTSSASSCSSSAAQIRSASLPLQVWVGSQPDDAMRPSKFRAASPLDDFDPSQQPNCPRPFTNSPTMLALTLQTITTTPKKNANVRISAADATSRPPVADHLLTAVLVGEFFLFGFVFFCFVLFRFGFIPGDQLFFFGSRSEQP